MDKVLYINACVRENSRTNILAKYLLDKLDDNIEEVKLIDTNITPLSAKTLKKEMNLYIKMILLLRFLIMPSNLKMLI